MNKNYLTYPVKTMNITQGYSGNYSHNPHSSGSPADYPIDEAGADSGREYFYCPCDEVEIIRTYGVGTGGTNTVWMKSTKKVVMPYGEAYIVIMVTHPNDDDLSKIKAGQKFTRGTAMFREGTDGNATGNHFHIAVGTGTYQGTGWEQNSKGSWVLDVSGKNLKPEQAFYIDDKFTKIKNKNGLAFKTIPKDENETEKEPVKENDKPFYVYSGLFKNYNDAKEYRDRLYKAGFAGAIMQEYRIGDVDKDGEITAADARLALRQSVNLD